jgi:hypothetical protein
VGGEQDPVVRDRERHQVRHRCFHVRDDGGVTGEHDVELVDREDHCSNDEGDPDGLTQMRAVDDHRYRFTPRGPRGPLGAGQNRPAASVGAIRFSLDHSTSE